MDTAVSAVLGAAVFCILAALVPRDLHWLDAPEITAAAFGLGHAHPPGHPLVMVLLKGFLLLPVGDVAFRANLFTALFGAISASLVFRIGALAVGAVIGRPRLSVPRMVGGLIAAALFILSTSFWIQSLSIEVYTLNAALVLGALFISLRWPGDARAGALIAVLTGLGLANHHLLTILAFPAIAVAWTSRDIRKTAVAFFFMVLLLVVAGNYAYLWIRGLAGGWPAWADTSGLDGVFWVASARIFAGSVGGFDEPLAGLIGNLGKASWLLADNMSIVGIVAALGGLYFLLRRAGLRAAAVAILWIGLGSAAKVGMGILDPNNPDDHGYFLPVVAGVSVLASITVVFIGDFALRVRGVPRIAGLVVSISVALFCLGTAAFNGIRSAEQRTDVSAGRGLSTSILAGMPFRAVYLAFHYPVFFRVQYDQIVEGARPDLSLVHQSLYAKARGGGFYAGRIARDDPELAGLSRAFLQTGRLDWDEVRNLAKVRPVRIEPSLDVTVPGSDVLFQGWTFAVLPQSHATLVSPLRAPTPETHLRGLREILPEWLETDIETRRVIILHLASAATWLGRAGHGKDAGVLLRAALEFNPLDRWLGDMASQYAPR
jgi:hypothetical protein